MAAVYFDSKMTDAERRGKIFAGDIFVFSPRPSTLALVDFARELIEAAFAPLPPGSRNSICPLKGSSRFLGLSNHISFTIQRLPHSYATWLQSSAAI